MEREAHLQGILHISQRSYLSISPIKKPSPKVPLMESLAERCLTTIAFRHSSIKIPGIRTPRNTRFPLDGKRTPWREMPVSRDFLNIYSRVPSEGAPDPLHGLSSETDAPSPEPPFCSSQSPQ